MADKKISALTASTTPLAGTEVLPIVQSGSTVKVAVSDLTAGRAVSALSITMPNTEGATSYTGSGANIGRGAAFATGQAELFTTGTRPLGIGASGAANLNFYTGSTRAFYIDTNQNFVVQTAGKGIDFSANTHAAGMTSELLDWYEEGTWTPVLTFGGGSTGITYGTQTGKYTRMGDRVFFNLIIILTSQGSSTGGASISGLPFAAAEGVACSTLISNMSAVGTVPQSFASGSAVDLYYQTTGANAQYTHGNFTNTAQLYISGCYRV